jgi:hypothetical protein
MLLPRRNTLNQFLARGRRTPGGPHVRLAFPELVGGFAARRSAARAAGGGPARTGPPPQEGGCRISQGHFRKRYDPRRHQLTRAERRRGYLAAPEKLGDGDPCVYAWLYRHYVVFSLMWFWWSLLRGKQREHCLLRHLTCIAAWMVRSSLTDAVVADPARRDAPTTAWRSNTASTPTLRRRTARPVSVAEEREVMWPSAVRSRGIPRRKTDGRHISNLAT